MLEQIKNLYGQVHHKAKWMLEVSKKLDRTPGTLKSHWFGGFWAIPESEQPKVLKLLKKQIKKQDREKASAI